MEHEKIKTFKDLKFEKHPSGKGLQARIRFKDGNEVFVNYGHSSFRCDKNTFEVRSTRFWRKTNGIKGYMTKKQISFHMRYLQVEPRENGRFHKTFSRKQILAIELANEAVDFFGLNEKSRRRELVDKRRAIFNFLVRENGISLTTAGIIMNKDHATVMYNLSIYDQLTNDVEFKENVQLIEVFLSRHKKAVRRFSVTLVVEFESLNDKNAQEYAEEIAKINNGTIKELKQIEK